MNKPSLNDFVNSLNRQFDPQFKTTDLEKQFTQGIGGSKVKHVKTIAELYKQYLDKFQEYHILKESRHKEHIEKSSKSAISKSINANQQDIINPFDKQNKIKDYKLKPLKQFYRPYLSKSLGSWEIDIVFDGKQHYLFCININTKYLVVYEKQNITQTEILRCLDQLIKQQQVTNQRSDGESAIGSKMVQDFLQAHHIQYYMSKSKFTNQNRVVDRFIRTLEMLSLVKIWPILSSCSRQLNYIMTSYIVPLIQSIVHRRSIKMKTWKVNIYDHK
ncbi:MAG: hypothetical protein EZS28_024506 [Streblomastix strix]|uniref:Integrase catalytic domain-containing protein n=1 Tax=Streblomastix strix TaxID=222440 RepID=A0A5J4VBZ5_9EUKA|nr:MAG: hypothetical protein EZS28_024506 [Streblomastix strix]